MKKSHIKTPRTLGEGEWESGYYTPEEYDKATEQVTKYVIGLFLLLIVWLTVALIGGI